MDAKKNNIGQTIFICFGGLLIGGLMGALAGVYGFAALLPKSNNYGLGEGFGVGIAIVFAGIAGLVVGAVVGMVIFLFLARRQPLRIYLTGVSVLACLTGIVGTTLLVNGESRQEAKAINYREREQTRIQAAQVEDDANVAAYLKQAPTDVPPLLGNLYYPNATIAAPHRLPDPSYSLIILSTKDNLNKVAAFYQNLVPGGTSYNHSSRGNSYEVKTTRPEDGKPIEISVESDYANETQIAFYVEESAIPVSNTPPQALQSGQPTSQSQPLSVTAPASPNFTIPPSASTPDPAFLQTYGSLAYPNAIETLTSLKPLSPDIPFSNCLQATMDPYNQVVKYYQAKVNTVSQTDTLYTGTTNRSSDGRLTTITIRTGALGKTYISLTAG